MSYLCYLCLFVGGLLSYLRYLCLFVGGLLSYLRYLCLFVGGLLSYLRYLCLFSYSDVCFVLFFVFVLCLVYPILPVFRYCPFCDCPFGAFRGVFLLCLRSVSCVLNVRSISGFSIF